MKQQEPREKKSRHKNFFSCPCERRATIAQERLHPIEKSNAVAKNLGAQLWPRAVKSIMTGGGPEGYLQQLRQQFLLGYHLKIPFLIRKHRYTFWRCNRTLYFMRYTATPCHTRPHSTNTSRMHKAKRHTSALRCKSRAPVLNTLYRPIKMNLIRMAHTKSHRGQRSSIDNQELTSDKYH